MNAALPSANQRNYGIDLLRIVSMLYIVICHAFGNGGILSAVSTQLPHRLFATALYMPTMCAVNIFGMISGYVGYSHQEKPYHYSNILIMWLQVVFYNLMVTILFELWNSQLVSLKDLKYVFFPLMGNAYWYFTAYTGLFFLIPMLNKGLRSCSNTMAKGIFWTLIFLFSLLGSAEDLFFLNRGYSFGWLLILYLLGAILKKTGLGETWSIPALIAGIAVCCGLSALLNCFWFQIQLIVMDISSSSLEAYTFPTHVFCAIFHVLLFSRLRFGQKAQKCIRFSAAGAFSIYLLNTQILIWQHILHGQFAYLAQEPVYRLAMDPVFFSIGFVFACVILDWFRQQLFRLLRLRQLADKLVLAVQQLY